MNHLPALIADLGLILSVAAITTLVFKKIKQPVVLGYIIAGVLVGPHVSFIPSVIDEENIKVWSEIGVIFLLFSLGLEFSFKKLASVGGTAGVTSVVEAVGMMALGYGTGQLLGWGTMDSIFLGGILSVSSTTIIIRAFDELGVKTQKYAVLVFGVLIVEDLVAILLLVLLSTVAVSQNFSGSELLWQMGKLGFFLVLWFLGGIFLIPTFLNRAKKLMNDETLLIVSVALCMVMVVLAVQAGFSTALGAFIMGSLLAETVQAERIEHLVRPVTDLFAAIFFVSVGMLIEPRMMLVYWFPILVITVVTVVGKVITTGSGALLAGEPLKRSVQASMSLTQIGEFSFIIATLGVTLGVTSNFLYPIAVAVSAITTFTTPFLIKLSPALSDRLERVLPKRWVAAIGRYSDQTDQVRVVSEWRVLLRAYVINMVVFSVLSLAVIIVGHRLLPPLFGSGFWWLDGEFIAGLVTFVLVLPFIWAMSLRRIRRDAYRSLWANKRQLRGPLVAIELVRIVAAILMLALLVNEFFSTGWALLASIVLMVLTGIIFRQRFQSFYHRVEARFFLNLNQRQRKDRYDLAPWDMHLAQVQVNANSAAVGQSLLELALREHYGVNIALIERGDRTIPAPGRDERLLPNDNLLVIGTDEQLAELHRALETPLPEDGRPTFTKEEIRLMKFRIIPQSPLVGQHIHGSGLRSEASAMVAGIERGEQRIMNPDGTTVFQANDLLWLVGNGERIRKFMEERKAVRE